MPPRRRRDLNRSPAYPAFDLEKAVSLAFAIYEVAELSYLSHETAIESCGYRSTSSSGSRAVSALIQFGLLDEKGSGAERRVRLSEIGRRVLLGSDLRDRDYYEALQEAALTPGVYSQLWDRFQAGHSDDHLRRFLLVELDFNPKTVDSVIEDYRATLLFAELVRPDDAGGQPGRRDEASQKDPAPYSLTFTLYNGQTATLSLPMPMSGADFELLESQIGNYLGYMKRQGSSDAGTPPARPAVEHEENIEPVRIRSPRGPLARKLG